MIPCFLVGNEIEFEEFVTCSRNDTPIPNVVTPGDSHQDRVRSATDALEFKNLNRMNDLAARAKIQEESEAEAKIPEESEAEAKRENNFQFYFGADNLNSTTRTASTKNLKCPNIFFCQFFLQRVCSMGSCIWVGNETRGSPSSSKSSWTKKAAEKKRVAAERDVRWPCVQVQRLGKNPPCAGNPKPNQVHQIPFQYFFLPIFFQKGISHGSMYFGFVFLFPNKKLRFEAEAYRIKVKELEGAKQETKAKLKRDHKV